MERVLSTYVNCSLGGMTSVYRARALANPSTRYDLVFTKDRGGESAFADLPNCNVRIVRPDRLKNYLSFALATVDYDLFTVTSQPELMNQVSAPARTKVVYEVHAPIETVVESEMRTLDVTRVDEIWAPSEWAADVVQQALPRRKHARVRAVPNLIDRTRFNPTAREVAPLRGRPGAIPVIWIGRMENVQKNYTDFLRVLRLLPPEYYGLLLFSFETDPARMSAVLGAAGMLGVEDRIDFYFNVPQQDVGALHRAVRDAGGVFCSTALSESYGYGVVEAGACGLPVAAYDVGPLSEHVLEDYRLVPVGDLRGMAHAVRALSGRVTAEA
ncbi:glycosyltransferase family 4 protein [Cellulomonas fimi]|uniref:Glycosyltransferase family 4 protein n=1 Tax=Cellulomonas fimi TaxID=1708 RepID=A0A7Y0LYH9_CELFI|nr:glycosyltransferase family 4 protein [Cellulomonas fimi]NMR20531.1 glycosyltransferase family 4 protein [Cellulomonas fimi]